MQHEFAYKTEVFGVASEKQIRMEYEVDDWPRSDGRARIHIFSTRIQVRGQWEAFDHFYGSLSDGQQNELDEELVSNWLRAKGRFIVEKETA